MVWNSIKLKDKTILQIGQTNLLTNLIESLIFGISSLENE